MKFAAILALSDILSPASFNLSFILRSSIPFVILSAASDAVFFTELKKEPIAPKNPSSFFCSSKSPMIFILFTSCFPCLISINSFPSSVLGFINSIC